MCERQPEHAYGLCDRAFIDAVGPDEANHAEAPTLPVRRPLLGLTVDACSATEGRQSQVVEGLAAVGADFYPVRVDWDTLDAGDDLLTIARWTVRWLGDAGFRVLLTVAAVDGVAQAAPYDLRDAAFDAPEMVARFDAALRQLLTPEVIARLDFVSIGYEVDLYLAEHPEAIAPFASFVESAFGVLEELAPGVPRGVTFTQAGLERDGGGAATVLLPLMDVVPVTFRPHAGRAEEAASAVERFVEGLGGRPVLYQALGPPNVGDDPEDATWPADLLGTVLEVLADARDVRAIAVDGYCTTVERDGTPSASYDVLVQWLRLPTRPD